ncbi:hypothetical protein BLNAU_8452 [Blattamonas nauphoetae]|uniref:Uncharacterized protein n=1 Tax=Blattamonas nauphoetae TaxID=2049346 RepID=A0ABQ9XYP0_9EUKA|nr:hypothetical protein BLNAU_8452 [Blattamonas nauphoetae]
MDRLPFQNWSEDEHGSDDEKAVVFQSLVATITFQSVFDVSLEAKAVKFLKYVEPHNEESADHFLHSLGRTDDESLKNFVQCIGVLLSSTSQIITTTAMKMLDRLIWTCSSAVYFTLVKADLIPQLINTLNPQSLLFTEAEDIHINVMKIITHSLWLTSPYGIASLGIEDDDGQQAVHETVFKQSLIPSEKYRNYLCTNRSLIVDGDQAYEFMILLAQLLRISPYYQPTMKFVLHIPVVLTIPSCLAFFEDDRSIWNFQHSMNTAQQEWNEKGGEARQIGKTVHEMLRMEGFEDVSEEKLQNDQNELSGRWIVAKSIQWNILQAMNLP